MYVCMYVFFSSRGAELSGRGGHCRVAFASVAASQKVPVSRLAIRSSPLPCVGHFVCLLLPLAPVGCVPSWS